MIESNSRDDRARDGGCPPDGAPLWAHACDVLASRLSAPEGIFPARWSPADGPAGDEIDLNEMLPLCAAWSAIDPAVARDLVLSALAAQDSDGALPRRVRSDGFAPDAHPPWPLIAVAANLAAGDSPHPDFVAVVLPALESHLERTLAHHDPGGSGRPRWQSREESFLPDVWDEGVLSADLAAMIAAEIEAVLSLASRAGAGGASELRFRARLRLYESALETYFRDPATATYPDRDETGAPTSRVTLSAFMPLLIRGLPGETRDLLQERILSGRPLGADPGIPLWERWPEDAAAPPVPARHQAIVWAALCAGRAGVPTATYRARTLEFLAAELARSGRLPEDFGSASSREHASPAAGSSVMAAATAVAMLQPSGVADGRAGRVATWMEAHRLGLAAAVVGIAAFALIGVGAFSLYRRAPPGSSAEASLNLARECHRAGDYARAIRLYREFLSGTKPGDGTIRVLLGNALFRSGLFTEAEAEYRSALGEEVSSLHGLYNLGLALHRQGRPEEAAYVFGEFVKTYSTDYPELAQRARIALDVIQNGTNSKPTP
jgi:tetratricopeptide (TPR) repeat protein